jgi:hypothetical protein
MPVVPGRGNLAFSASKHLRRAPPLGQQSLRCGQFHVLLCSVGYFCGALGLRTPPGAVGIFVRGVDAACCGSAAGHRKPEVVTGLLMLGAARQRR